MCVQNWFSTNTNQSGRRHDTSWIGIDTRKHKTPRLCNTVSSYYWRPSQEFPTWYRKNRGKNGIKHEAAPVWLNVSSILFQFVLGFVVIRPEKSVKHFTIKFLRNQICQERLNLKKQDNWVLHHDSASLHTSLLVKILCLVWDSVSRLLWRWPAPVKEWQGIFFKWSAQFYGISLCLQLCVILCDIVVFKVSIRSTMQFRLPMNDYSICCSQLF